MNDIETMNEIAANIEKKFGPLIDIVKKRVGEYRIACLRDTPVFPDKPAMTIAAYTRDGRFHAFEHGHYDLTPTDAQAEIDRIRQATVPTSLAERVKAGDVREGQWIIAERPALSQFVQEISGLSDGRVVLRTNYTGRTDAEAGGSTICRESDILFVSNDRNAIRPTLLQVYSKTGLLRRKDMIEQRFMDPVRRGLMEARSHADWQSRNPNRPDTDHAAAFFISGQHAERNTQLHSLRKSQRPQIWVANGVACTVDNIATNPSLRYLPPVQSYKSGLGLGGAG